MSTTLQPDQIRIRMYRVGIGDCFLMSLPSADGHRHILIDCGVHFRGDIKTLPKIVKNIREETDDHLNLVVVTHAHQDHISGFGTYAKDWAQVTVDEIWLPWTEDTSDAQALAVRTKQLSLARRLRDHLKFTNKLSSATDNILENFVSFNLASNADSIRVARGGFKGAQKLAYWQAGAVMAKAAGIPGLDVRVMGPSRDESVLTTMDPPAGQRWLSKKSRTEPTERIQPFPGEIRRRPRSKRHGGACVLTTAEERELQDAVAANDALALMLDDLLNNTSLVLLFRYKGVSLLFPGDAQWGNSFTDALLNEITFVKVGHHGSHNAIPKGILSKLTHPQLAAMVSTQRVPFPSIPELAMINALTMQSQQRTVRSDWVSVDGAPSEQGPATLPLPFQRGALWIDYLRAL